MSTTINSTDTPLFSVRNHHVAECGTPPRIDDLRPSQYLGYFENQYGERQFSCTPATPAKPLCT